MALCPFAVHELLPENNEQGRINPTTVICHRAVSSAKDLYGYWNSPGVVLESHFYIAEDGTIYQYMDTNVRADANVDANAFAVSIETWDGGNTPDWEGWNSQQVYALKKLILWICDTHGIKKGPALTWNGGGIGGHNWFPEPWADGPRGCPGTERNRQLREDIIPAVASGNIEDDDWMTDIREPVVTVGGITYSPAQVFHLMAAFVQAVAPGTYNDAEGNPVVGDIFGAALFTDNPNTPAEQTVSLRKFYAELREKGVADVDESALAEELARRGIGGASPSEVKDAVIAALRQGTA